jgi:hypothetical protein
MSAGTEPETQSEPNPTEGWIALHPETKRSLARAIVARKNVELDGPGMVDVTPGRGTSPDANVAGWRTVRDRYEIEHRDMVILEAAGVPHSGLSSTALLERLTHAQRHLEAAEKYRVRELAKVAGAEKLEALRLKWASINLVDNQRESLEARAAYLEEKIAQGQSGRVELRQVRQQLEVL